jgi:hypothetical protein
MNCFTALPMHSYTASIKRLSTGILFSLVFVMATIKSTTAAINKTNQADSLLASVAAEMQQILDAYQVNRDVMKLFISRYGNHALVVQQVKQQFRKDDSITLIKILSIVNTYGWKGKAHFGEAAPLAIIITFMHASLNYQKKYFPLMEEAAKKGTLPADGFAIIADWTSLHDSGQQIYGTQFNFSSWPNPHYIPLPIAAINELDQRRVQLKLEPYQSFVKNYNPDNMRQYCMY